MKLLHNTFIKLSGYISIIFILWGVLFYFTIFNEVIDETDDILENKKSLIIKKVLNDSAFVNNVDETILSYSITPITKSENIDFKNKFYNSTRYVEIEQEDEPVRVLESVFKMNNGKYYNIKIMLSTLEQEDLVETIIFYFIALYLLFIILTFIGTRIILKKTFNPIYKLLEWLDNIQPGEEVHPLINPTSIQEYSKLNAAAYNMAERNEKAFSSQKQFIENASHELQTPLAIAVGKIELMAEDETLKENQYNLIQQIHETLNRAIKLNKSLLLLMKVENGQTGELTNVSFLPIIKNITEDLSDIYEYKNIEITTEWKNDFEYKCNEELSIILITNILKNAFTHTNSNGSISIYVDEDKIIVSSNDNLSTELDKNLIFNRFFSKTININTNSTGLGLSISKAIATLFKLNLEYSFKNNHHIFTISKNKKF